MKLKQGVRIFGARPEMLWAVIVAGQVYKELGNYENFVITSVRDGTHKRGSDHYVGNAIDIRVWGFKGTTLNMEPTCDATAEEASQMIQARLTNEFEVFFEGDHIHIGFDVQNL